jgi:hypothetical protein
VGSSFKSTQVLVPHMNRYLRSGPLPPRLPAPHGLIICAPAYLSTAIVMDEPSWRKTKLSLERPYRDDNGERIPVLLDITSEGEHVYEP